MTAQEQQMLQGLADRVNGTQLPDKDVDAERMIQQTLGPNPDAMYVMAQTILVQQYALDQARQQMAALRAQLDQARQASAGPKRTGSFLGNLLGHHEEPQRPAAAPPPPPMPVPQAPAQYQQAPMYAPSGGYPLPGEPQGGGFLRSAMQTATGVPDAWVWPHGWIWAGVWDHSVRGRRGRTAGRGRQQLLRRLSAA
jgi:hypothetical protein